MFRVLYPSSGVHETVDAIIGISHVSVWCRFKSVEDIQGRTATSLCHGQLGSLFIIKLICDARDHKYKKKT
jgi:hypothetical protein